MGERYLRSRCVRGSVIRSVGARLNRNCEYFFRAGRRPARLATTSVTVRFNGNARVLPELEGPERVLPRMPNFSP
jgi:hypothetical protein